MSHPDMETLSAFLDGDLPEGRRETVRTHLAECRDCTAAFEDLRGLVAALGNLPAQSPPRDLWSGIQDTIRSPSEAGKAHAQRPFRRPLLVAASILLAGFVAAWIAGRGLVPTSSPEEGNASREQIRNARAEGYAEAIRDLEGLLDEIAAQRDAAVLRLVRGEIGLLDRAIADYRQALQEEPGNPWLQERLAQALRRKWNHLREVPSLVPVASIQEGQS